MEHQQEIIEVISSVESLGPLNSIVNPPVDVFIALINKSKLNLEELETCHRQGED